MPTINFSGIASGIDSNALIDAVSKATRQARVTPSQTKVSEMEETNSIFAELKTKLEALSDLGLKFATQSGGALAKQATSSDETNVTASASPGAANGSYSLNVTQKAKNHTHSFDTRFAATESVLNAAINDADPEANRRVRYTIGEGADLVNVDVVLTSTTTVSQFVSAFNLAANGRATASFVNVGTDPAFPYAIVVNTNYEGESKGLIGSVTVGSSITDPNGDLNTSDGVFLTSTEDPAVDAVFTLTGVTGNIIRSTNTVSDVIQGVTFNLQSSGTATVTVADDISATQSKVQDFIDSYNDVVAFINENNLIRREEDGNSVTNVFSPLAKTRTDDNFLVSMRTAISSSNYSSGSAIKIMADLGIKTERDGTLKFVTDDPSSSNFKDAMESESNSVNEILMRFGDIVSTTAGVPSVMPGGGVIYNYIRFNGLIDSTVNGNTAQITNLNDRIAEAEASILQAEEAMRARFARLESLTGKLQGQQQALTSALAGLR